MSITYTSIASLLAQPFQRLTSAMWNTAVLLLDQLYLTGGNAVTSILQNGSLIIPNNITANTGYFLYEVYVQGQPVLTEQDPIYIAGFISTAFNQINAILQSQERLYQELYQLPQQIYNVATPLGIQLAQTGNKILQNLYNIDYYNYKLLLKILSLMELYAQQEINSIYQVGYELISQLKILGNQTKESFINAIYSASSFLQYVFNYIYLATVTLAQSFNKITLYLSPPAIEGLNIPISTKPQPLISNTALTTARIILQNLSRYIIYIGNNLYNNFPILPNSEIEIHVSKPSNVYAWATGNCTVYALFEVVQS